MKGFDRTRPLNALTVGELFDLLEKHFGLNAQKGKEPVAATVPPKRLLYGVKGIEDFFHVSHRTAQKYKDTFLQPAVSQNGRVIVTDAELALQLFNENNESHAE